MRFFKDKKKEEAKELENRAKQFMQEYSVIRARYRCDFMAYLEMINEGEGGIRPRMRIIDVTEQVEKEEEAEKKAAELKIKKEQNGNQKPEN